MLFRSLLRCASFSSAICSSFSESGAPCVSTTSHRHETQPRERPLRHLFQTTTLCHPRLLTTKGSVCVLAVRKASEETPPQGFNKGRQSCTLARPRPVISVPRRIRMNRLLKEVGKKEGVDRDLEAEAENPWRTKKKREERGTGTGPHSSISISCTPLTWQRSIRGGGGLYGLQPCILIVPFSPPSRAFLCKCFLRVIQSM